MKRKLLLLIIVILQLSFIAGLGYVIYEKRKNVLGIADINPISKEDIVYNPDSKLKYFYEPKANTTEEIHPWMPYKAKYTINSDTLNERRDYSTDKPPGTFRIITMGSSPVFGLYVDTKNNFSEQLEDLLNSQLKCGNYKKIEVINLAYSGYDMQYEVERYKIRGQKYNPDLVLWLMTNNDFQLINEFTLPRIMHYATIAEKEGKMDTAEDKRKNYINIWHQVINELNNTINQQSILDYQLNLLDQFKNFYHGPLVFMSFSNHETTFPHLTSLYAQALKNFLVTHHNAFYYDQITNVNSKPELVFPNDGHPNIKGHTVIANDIYNYLIQNKFIPCESTK